MIKDVSIEITQKCVNRCIHCSSCSTEECTTMLQLDTIHSVIHGLQQLHVERICLSGGEPFLHPNIVDIVKQISNCNIVVDIYSSGIVKDTDGPKPLSFELLSAMKKAGLRALLFNLQSANEKTYDLITQSKGHFPLLCESIANASKCGIRTEIHFVPMLQNMNDAEDVIHFSEKMGINQVNFLKLVPHGRALENAQTIMINDLDLSKLRSRLVSLQANGKTIRLGLPLSIRGTTPPCHAVKEKLYIKFDGSVFGCEAFKYIKFLDEHRNVVSPDNIFEKDVEEIYANSEYLRRSIMLVESYENCKVDCENCPVQKYLRSGEKENEL